MEKADFKYYHMPISVFLQLLKEKKRLATTYFLGDMGKTKISLFKKIDKNVLGKCLRSGE